jgi:adenine-specific DNA-methyltransferase
METKMSAQASDLARPYYLGESSGAAYYFYYEKDAVTTLDAVFLARIAANAEQYIIYADRCTMPDDKLRNHNVTFKKIPRDITRL